MPGIPSLNRTQIGVEATAGGSTDLPTTIWRGMSVLKDNLRTVFPKEKIGLLGGSTRSYIPETGGEVLLTDEASFESLGYIFQSGIKTVAPSSDATGSGFSWTWAMQAVSTDPIATTDLSTLVIESGDNVGAEIAHYGFVREFTLGGKAGEALSLSATIQTRAPATTTFTAGLTAPTVETILFSTGAMYIDPSTDAAGTTIASQTLFDASLKVKTGWQAKNAKDNRTDFSFIKRTDDEITLDVTFEHETIALAEKAAWRAGTERVIRLTFVGSALTTAGTLGTKKLTVDLYGKWLNFGAGGLEEMDADNVYKGTFRCAYSNAASNKMVVTLVNELSALP